MEGRTVPTRTLAYMCSGTSPDASVIMKTEQDIFFFFFEEYTGMGIFVGTWTL